MIGSILTGLTGLLGGLAAIMATRSKRKSEDNRAIKRGARLLQKRFLAAMAHIFELEERLVEARRPVPPRPEILETDDDDDTPPSTRAASSVA